LEALSSFSALSEADSAWLVPASGSVSSRRPSPLLPHRRDSESSVSGFFEVALGDKPEFDDWLSTESESGELVPNRPRGLLAGGVVARAICPHFTRKANTNAMTFTYNLSTRVDIAC
jgi:hypothetical protein